MAKREDIHRPSKINPEEYTAIPFQADYLGMVDDSQFERQLEEDRRSRHGWVKRHGYKYADHGSAGTCQCCGANALYVEYFLHRPTGTVVRFGSTCAEKLGFGINAAFRIMKRRVKCARDFATGKARARVLLLEDYGFSEEEVDLAFSTLDEPGLWDMASEVWPPILEEMGEKPLTTDDADIGEIHKQLITAKERYLKVCNGFACERNALSDLLSGLIRYGSWSDKQREYAKTLVGAAMPLSFYIERAVEAFRTVKREQDAAQDCPSGRVLVTGRVLSVRVIDNNYGTVTKMLVLSTDGWKVWGSVPSGLYGVGSGANIEFSADITPSPEDRLFGYFKRPTKAKIIGGSNDAIL